MGYPVKSRGRPRHAGIIASFNQAVYIEESVISLAPQVDEIIVADDCSTDDSVERILALGIDTVRILRMEERVGVSRACNLAAESTSAHIIVLQGGDDRSLPGRVNQHVLDFDRSDVTLSASLPSIIDSRGHTLNGNVADEFTVLQPGEDPLQRLIFGGNFICAPTAAMRREDFLDMGGYPVGIDLLQDHALWLKALSVGKLALSTRPLVEYRKHGTNTSRSYVGLDSPRRRRHAAELEYVITSFIESAPDDTLDRLCTRVGLDIRVTDESSRLASRSFLLLTHNSRVIQRRGLNLLLGLVKQLASWELLARFGVNKELLESLAQVVDHENSGDIARAFQTASSLRDRAVNR
jgi:glycosyltransferase involved in cell wall biosynthesis